MNVLADGCSDAKTADEQQQTWRKRQRRANIAERRSMDEPQQYLMVDLVAPLKAA